MAVGVGRDSKGKLQVIVGMSDDYGYMRPAINNAINEAGEKRALGFVGHAEEQILQYMKAWNLRPITIGAGRPICAQCAKAIADAKATPATPLK
jgi:filamentous hemagglutinin